MSTWLLNLPTWLREGGLTVEEYPGWETRSRSSGGYDAVWAIGVHHTASSTTPANDLNYMLNNADAKPIGALYLARDGVVTVCAAGATNCQGRGGPYKTSKGTIPLDAGNRYMLSIEAANAGTGEHWPEVQQDAYVKMCHILVTKLGLAWGDIVAHFEWSPGRKYDPAGSSRYASGGALWDMDKFRGDCRLASDTPTPPAPEPEPEPPAPGDDCVKAEPGDGGWSLMRKLGMDPTDTKQRAAFYDHNFIVYPDVTVCRPPGDDCVKAEPGDGGWSLMRKLGMDPTDTAARAAFYDHNYIVYPDVTVCRPPGY